MINDRELLTGFGLPEALRRTMFAAANGEVAWPLDQMLDAVTWIASCNLAIVGGEAWLVDDVGHINGLVPIEGSSIPAVRSWAARDRSPNEGWRDFVERCGREAAAALQAESISVAGEIPAAVRSQLRYNLTFEPEP